MFGRLARLMGTVLVVAAAFVAPVLATSAPASADTVVDGCTIVSSPTSTNFTNCPGAELIQVDLSGVDLSFADLAGAQLGLSNLSGADLSNANLSSASLVGDDLSNANLSSANLTSTGFVFCADLPDLGLGCPFKANLTDANLTGTNLTDEAFAVCLDFSGGSACGAADLSGADLSGDNLTGAALGSCGLSTVCAGATLTGATLTGATLTGADVTETILVPSAQNVLATSSAGAVVTWPAQSVPGATLGTCTPPSGSTFSSSFGPTFVECQVTDDFGNVATGGFFVRVGTTTSVSSSLDPSVVGQPVTYTATVSPDPGGGTVAFTDNGSSITGCTAVPLSAGTATCSTTPGTVAFTEHDIVATYSGTDNGLNSSVSSTLFQAVRGIPTSISLTSSPNPPVVGQPVTYTATVSPDGGGTVYFTDNGADIPGCTAAPVSGGTATCTIIPSTIGEHRIDALYEPSKNFDGSDFTLVVEVMPQNCKKLAGCNISGLDLSNADLLGANLQGANLLEANLTGTDLRGANLQGANLMGANLTGTDLVGAVLKGANLNNVKWANTACPDGTYSQNDGGTCVGHLSAAATPSSVY